MSKGPIIIIIIPAYNESATLPAVVSELIANKYEHIVIVDDCSMQNMLPGIRDLKVHYLRHRVNLGQGAALQTGFQYAKDLAGDIIVTFDADGQHDILDISALIQPIINKEADIVFGSRFLNKTTGRIPFPRILLLQCARIINYIFSGILLSDAHNGLRAFNMKTLKLFNLTENRMAHATEILLMVQKHKLRYKETGVNVRYTVYSKKKGQAGLDSIKILFDLLLHKLFK
jgi:glycosyltransferase involved in cell wall biosynthesis